MSILFFWTTNEFWKQKRINDDKAGSSCPKGLLALSKELADMVKHIYGNINVMKYEDRPNMFIKELKLYIDYLKNEIFEYSDSFSSSQIKKWNSFKNNLSGGIQYYMDLFGTISYFKIDELKILQQIKQFQYELNEIKIPEPVIA